jgi:hypothetical protein
MFRAKLPALFSTGHKIHACHATCTLSPLDAALTMCFAKQKTQHHMSKVLFFPRKMTMEVSKARRLTRKNATHLLKTLQMCCACHTERLLTRYEAHGNVRKCHASHAKRRCPTFETSKSDRFCSSSHRHGHSDLMADGCQRLRSVANGCGRLRT